MSNNLFYFYLISVQPGIEKECLTPILPSSRYLDNNTVESDISGIPILENEKFIIQIALPLGEIKMRFPNLFLYLTSELSKDVKQGYICRNRKPWYNIGKHNSPLFLCTYMGRVKDGKSPFRFIANDSIALIANSMLGLYPKINVIKGLEEGKITMVEITESIRKNR